MTTSPLPNDEQFSDPDATQILTADLDDAALLADDDQFTGPRCEKCNAPVEDGQMAVCRACGWYASLGIFVELDSEWEAATEAVSNGETTPSPNHLQVWINLLPRWAWVVIVSALVVVVESLIARLGTAGSLRTAWSVWQLGIGAVIFFVCHVVSFLIVAAHDAEFSVLDLVLRPLRIWNSIARELPRRLWFFNVGTTSLTAVVASFLIIGALPYHRLLDWGFEPPPEKNLVAAIAQQAQQVNGEEMSMEEAMNQFADKAGVDDLEPEDLTPEPEPREQAECVVIGFRVNREEKLHTLILATAYRSRLVYAGTVTPSFTPREAEELKQLFSQARSRRPFLDMRSSAMWVKPVFTCRVSHTGQSEQGRLTDIQWEEFLDVIELD